MISYDPRFQMHTVRHRRARPAGRASDSVDAKHAVMSRSFHDSRIGIAQAKQDQVSGKFNGSLASSRFKSLPGKFLATSCHPGRRVKNFQLVT